MSDHSSDGEPGAVSDVALFRRIEAREKEFRHLFETMPIGWADHEMVWVRIF